MSRLYVGGRTVFTKTFYNPISASDWDPPVVLFEQRKPDGTVVEWRYGVDPEITKLAVGQYQVEIPWTQSGAWFLRWQALADEADVDSAMGAVEEHITVAASKFANPILPNP